MTGRPAPLSGRSPVDSRGGQLQIAGVVVGNWGPNVQSQQTKSQGNVAPPHVTAVGSRRGMRGLSPGGRTIARGRGLQVRVGSAGSGYNGRPQVSTNTKSFMDSIQ